MDDNGCSCKKEAFVLSSLPEDALLRISRFLRPEDIVALSACCKALFWAMEKDIFWEHAIRSWTAAQNHASGLSGKDGHELKRLLGLKTLSATYRCLRKLCVSFWPVGLWYLASSTPHAFTEADAWLDQVTPERGLLCYVGFQPCSQGEDATFVILFDDLRCALSRNGKLLQNEFKEVGSMYLSTNKGAAGDASGSFNGDYKRLYQEYVDWHGVPFDDFLSDNPDGTKASLIYRTLPRRESLTFCRISLGTLWNTSLWATKLPTPGSIHILPEPGLYSGVYGSHGLELLWVDYVIDRRTGEIYMTGKKLIGDVNVPATKESFRSRLTSLSLQMGPIQAGRAGDFRPIFNFGGESISEVRLEDRDVQAAMLESFGTINRRPGTWNPERIPVVVILYQKHDSDVRPSFVDEQDSGDVDDYKPAFSVLWEDRGSPFRHVIDFYSVDSHSQLSV